VFRAKSQTTPVPTHVSANMFSTFSHLRHKIAAGTDHLTGRASPESKFCPSGQMLETVPVAHPWLTLPRVSLKLHLCQVKLFGWAIFKRPTNDRSGVVRYQHFGLPARAQPLGSEARCVDVRRKSPCAHQDFGGLTIRQVWRTIAVRE
jgi:hypothetical protein